MEIVDIFAPRLFAVHYDDQVDNEFDRLMDLWTDVSYLSAYAKSNNVHDVHQFVEDLLSDAEQIDDFLNDLNQNNKPYEMYFEPLQESERTKILALQKGKVRRNQLRLYAVKIHDDCFLITGGAIKMSLKMQEHPDTLEELKKLRAVRSYLNNNGVFDEDSFFELLSEEL